MLPNGPQAKRRLHVRLWQKIAEQSSMLGISLSHHLSPDVNTTHFYLSTQKDLKKTRVFPHPEKSLRLVE
jgi:hypothetical protein